MEPTRLWGSAPGMNSETVDCAELKPSKAIAAMEIAIIAATIRPNSVCFEKVLSTREGKY